MSDTGPPGLAPQAEADLPGPEGELRRLSPLTPVARSGIFLAFAVFAGGRQVLQEGRVAGLAIGAVAVVLLGAVFGFASWYRTFFRITATELRIDTGVISRRSRRVRLDRILEIGIDQPLIARLLGLAELKIETATADSEVSLAYLPLAEAHRVREVLLEERGHVRVAEGEPAEPSAQEEPRLLVHVPVRWQLQGLLLSGETVGLALIAVVVVVLVLVGVPFGAFGVGLATVLGTAVSLARKVVGWWDWKVSAVPTGLQVRHGMFAISTRTFNVARLQGVRVTEPVLQRPLGLARLELSVAGGGAKDKDENGSRGVALPVAPFDLVNLLAGDLIGTRPDTVTTTRPPTRARWIRPLGRPFLRFGMDQRVVVARQGWFARRTDVVPLARVQSFRVRQGPLQRRLGLATVHADTPAGLVTIAGPHRDPVEARRLVADGAALARRPAPPADEVADIPTPGHDVPHPIEPVTPVPPPS